MERDDEVAEESTERKQSSLRRRLTQGLLALALIAVGVAGGLLWATHRPPSGVLLRDGASDTAKVEVPARPSTSSSAPAMPRGETPPATEALEIPVDGRRERKVVEH